MDTKKLRQKILDLAIHGKLVPPVCRQAGKILTMNPEPPIKGKKCWFTYVIECEDGSFYKGYTDDLFRRYKQHCDGNGAEYTKKHKPKQLYYWEMHYTQENALNREKYLKSGIGREWFKREVVDKPENFEPASVLLERIRAEKERLIKEGKIKKSKASKTSDTPHYEQVPFEVPSSWKWCNLEDICVFLSRGKSPKYSEDDRTYPVFAQKCNLKDGGISLEQARFLDPSTINKWNEVYKLQTGDVLVNSTGTGTVGRTRLFDATCLGNYPFVVPDSHVSVIRTSSQINSKFVFAYISSKFIQQYLEDNLAGSTNQKELYIGVLSNLQVPIPSYSEQERIVTEIERWFALIDQIEQGKVDLQTTIKQAKSKILDLAIHGKLVPQNPADEPASELLKRINPKAEFACDNGQYGKIPQGWCICKLRDLCSFLSRGKSPKYSDDDRTYPVFAQKCNLKDGGISLEQARFLDPSTINKWNEVYKLQTGDVLVNSTGTGTVGRTRLFNTNYLGNYPFVVPDSHVSVIRVSKSICPQYIYAYISSDSIQQYMEDNLAGSTNQKELYIGVLENMKIFLPPLTEQHRIVSKIEELFSSLDNIQKALEV